MHLAPVGMHLPARLNQAAHHVAQHLCRYFDVVPPLKRVQQPSRPESLEHPPGVLAQVAVLARVRDHLPHRPFVAAEQPAQHAPASPRLLRHDSSRL